MREFRLVDVFHTLQGEGFHSGKRALFIRLPHCNLSCQWCDTEFDKYEIYSRENLEKIIKSEKCRFAVITGGEPLLNKQTEHLIKLLYDLGFYITCETNGTQPMIQGIDWVTCSPKRFQKEPYFIHPNLFPYIKEFKYVVDKDFDFSILNKISILDKNKTIFFYLSPEFNTLNESFERIQNYIKENTHWKLSLQIHKWLNIK